MDRNNRDTLVFLAVAKISSTRRLFPLSLSHRLIIGLNSKIEERPSSSIRAGP